jgi:hypothetical protein
MSVSFRRLVSNFPAAGHAATGGGVVARLRVTGSDLLFRVVGLAGFEPTTP